MQIIHIIVKYPELYNNLNIVSVSMIPLELRAGIENIKLINDGALLELFAVYKSL